MKINEKSCSALVFNGAGGYMCKHGHWTLYSCFGSSYGGNCVPPCIDEERFFDEETKTIKLKKWNDEYKLTRFSK